MRHRGHNATANPANPPVPRNVPGIPDRESRDHPNLTTLDSRSHFSAISNRHSVRLEITVSPGKQTTAPRSKRHFLQVSATFSSPGSVFHES
jgi:hypothetical protein